MLIYLTKYFLGLGLGHIALKGFEFRTVYCKLDLKILNIAKDIASLSFANFILMKNSISCCFYLYVFFKVRLLALYPTN